MQTTLTTQIDAGQNTVPNPGPGFAHREQPQRSMLLPRCAAFLLGLGSHLNLRIIGYFPISEIVMLVSLPFFLPQLTRTSSRRLTRWIIPLAFLWLANAVITDLWQQTEWSLAARGLGRIVVYSCCIPLLTLFLQRDTYAKTLLFTLAQIPSSILSASVLRSGVHEGREFVSGRAAEINFETHWSAVAGVTAQLLLLVVYPRSRLLAYGLGLAMVPVQLLGGSRATALIYLIGPVICMARDLAFHKGSAEKKQKLLLRGTVLLLVVGLSSMFAYVAYVSVARSGQLGERAYRKYMTQSRSAYGLLFAGRPQVLGGLLAAYRSPIVGYGSWPLDREGFFAEACELLDLHLDPLYYAKGYPLIPTHSHVLCAWVENGVMGLLFWSYAFYLFARGTVARYADDRRFGLFLVISCVSALWHIVFSPMSGRLTNSFLMALLLNQTAEAFVVRDGRQKRDF